MSKKILILASMLVLGGCALPVPLQIASWAVDGLLLITTEKTMADHSVSLVVQRDCAMVRVVTEGTFCREDDSATAVAEAKSPPAIEVDVAALVAKETANDAVMAHAGDDVAERLASLETAAGRGSEPVHRESNWQEAPVEDAQPDEAALAAARWQAIIDAPAFFDHPTEETIGLQSIPESKPEPTLERAAAEPTPGLAFEAPAGNDDISDVQRVDDRLYLGDAGHDPLLNAQDEVTILGGAGGDSLFNWVGNARNPAPIQADARSLERISHARRHRRPPGRAGARGRDPPGLRRRRRRVHDPRVPREGPGD